MLMNRFRVRYTSAVIIVIMAAMPILAEHVFLKDGSIIKGKIVNETANEVVLRDEQNKVISFPHTKVLRVLYTNLKMGKIYIQKKDGEGIVAYMVDEDQDNYVFRKDLYKPAEFIINRSDVLFLSEKNPSKLKTVGNAGTDRVSLSWMPPYDAVKKYNIYIKKNKADKYVLIDNTKDKTITLKDLSAKTEYFIIVTSIDSDNYESLPSNELKISTSARVDVKLKNGKSFKAYLLSEDRDSYTLCNDLDKPADFTVKRADVIFITERFPSNLTGKAGSDSISLKWAESYIAMKEYKIYTKKKGEEYKLVSTSRDNSFTLRGLLSSTEYTIKVTGIAKDKTETLPSNEIKITTNIKTAEGKIKLPSGIRLAYMLAIPFTAPVKDVYTDMHGADLTYSYFFNNYISIKTGVNFVMGYIPLEDGITVQSSLNIGVNFGFPVIGFIYPYAGVSFRGIWLHDYARSKYLDFGGIGVDGNIGIAFTLVNFFGLYLEYTIGWATALDKSYTDISSMSIKAGLYFRF